MDFLQLEEDDNDMVNANGKTNILDLNDDCLECIFERVHDLTNQINIAKTCKRFRNIILGLWKRQPEYKTLKTSKLTNLLPSSDDLDYFLGAMKNEFNTLIILDECLCAFLGEMRERGIDCFNSIDRCGFEDELIKCNPNDKDIESLTKLVPNLKYLYITVPISGRFITNFKYLEELMLYNAQPKAFELDQECLKDILLKLKYLRCLDMRSYEISYLRLMPEISECVNLQELRVNLNSLKPVLEQVLKLPRLKLLQVLLDYSIEYLNYQHIDIDNYKIYETKEYYHILREKGALIQGLAIDFNFLPVTDTWIRDLSYLNPSNLKLLALGSFDFKYKEECLRCPFDCLETLSLRHAQNLKPGLILEVLPLCPKLRKLDICFCLNLDASFLNSLKNFLQKAKRSSSLCVYYCGSGLVAEIEKNLSFWTSQEYIQLVNDYPPDSDMGSSYVQQGYSFYF